MGIYDREYYRQGRSGFRLSAPRTAVGAIVLLNVAVFVVEMLDTEMAHGSRVVETLAVHVRAAGRPGADTLQQPWLWWQLLTYGFLHDPHMFQHIFFNMLTLFFLGRDIEQWYGTREFIRLYLVMLAFAAVIFSLANRVFEPQRPSLLFGASGAIAGVVVLYALNFPKRMMLFMFVIPMPAWLMGALAVGFDIWGATHPDGGAMMGLIDPHVAFTAHLAGAAFAFTYFSLHWNLGRLFQGLTGWMKSRSRPRLKVFHPPTTDPDAPVADEEVDRILEKIHREGEGSLTRKERRILETASREYQRRRRPD